MWWRPQWPRPAVIHRDSPSTSRQRCASTWHAPNSNLPIQCKSGEAKQNTKLGDLWIFYVAGVMSCGKLSEHEIDILNFYIEHGFRVRKPTMNKFRQVELTFTSGKFDTSSFDPCPVTQRPNILFNPFELFPLNGFPSFIVCCFVVEFAFLLPFFCVCVESNCGALCCPRGTFKSTEQNAWMFSVVKVFHFFYCSKSQKHFTSSQKKARKRSLRDGERFVIPTWCHKQLKSLVISSLLVLQSS